MDYKKTLETVRQMVEDGQVSQETAELYFPELAESEDEKIRKAIIEFFKLQDDNTTYSLVPKNDILAWLEKQGKQEPFDYENATIQQTDFAPKVEPKFHEGEWIATSYGKVNQVITVDKDGDGYTLDDGVYFTGSWCDMYHLWDITKDAKAGDVLASDNSIFIFREEYIAEKPIAYCGLMNGLFIEGENACWTNEYCNPATKEQRDLLFQKMKEAGYEWNADKKELKKISQRMISAEAKEAMYDKPAWSEEDENHIIGISQTIFGAIRHNVIGHKTGDMQINWLRSLKERVQPKQEWSKEDERNLQGIIDEIEANKNQAPDYDLATYDRFLSWLKSLRP